MICDCIERDDMSSGAGLLFVAKCWLAAIKSCFNWALHLNWPIVSLFLTFEKTWADPTTTIASVIKHAASE